MLIKVKVKANAEENSVEKVPDNLFSEEGYEGLYFVKIRSEPEGGRANLELIKTLSKYFKKEVKIKSGYTSKQKVVEVLE